MAVSKKVIDRISLQVKKYQAVLNDALARDISESDTVVIIGDMISDILGYKKYSEITTEFSIRGTYVDLAVKIGNEVRFLIEAKAIGQQLKDNHIKQAIDYGANHGIEWVVLTNGILWQVYKIHFKQPIDKALVFEIDLIKSTPKNTQLIEGFWNLSREGFTQSSMTAFFQQQQATSKFSIAALLQTDALILALKKELKRIGAGNKIDDLFLKALLQNEVVKRELIDSEEAKAATDYIKKTIKQNNKIKTTTKIQ